MNSRTKARLRQLEQRARTIWWERAEAWLDHPQPNLDHMTAREIVTEGSESQVKQLWRFLDMLERAAIFEEARP